MSKTIIDYLIINYSSQVPNDLAFDKYTWHILELLCKVNLARRLYEQTGNPR